MPAWSIVERAYISYAHYNVQMTNGSTEISSVYTAAVRVNIASRTAIFSREMVLA